MIKVKLNKPEFEYDIHSLIKAFYPGEYVGVSAEEKSYEEPIHIQMEVIYGEETIKLSWQPMQGEESGETEEGQAGKQEEKSGETERRQTDEQEEKSGGTEKNQSDKQGKKSGEAEKNRTAEQGEKSGETEKNQSDEQKEKSAETEKNQSDEQEEISGETGKSQADRTAWEKPQRIERQISVDFSDRTETKNRLKRCLYLMLSEVTGKKLPWGNLTGIRPTKIPMKMLEEGKSEVEIKSCMKETYFASDEKIALSTEIAKRELALLGQIDYENGYSLYIGIPFCPTTCLYCSFTSYPLAVWAKRVDDYLDALEKEIDFTAVKFAGKHLNSIYIGGGTPTTLEPYQLDRLIRKIKCSFDLSDCLEFTVEAGRPDSITREKLEVLRKWGISRISINPQTMKQETLDIIGRRHTVEQTTESFRLARELGFDNINMDLILGLPGEELSDVKNTMEQMKLLAPDNLTVHSLALKRAARLNMFREEYKNYKMVNTQEHMELVADYAAEMGLHPYYLYRQKSMAGNLENVGYAREGKAGVYNILIMEEKQTIIACGAGSITKRVYPDGRIDRCENVKDVAQYMERIGEMIERKQKLFDD